METVRIENTEKPFLVKGFDSSASSDSQSPIRRSSSNTNKQQFIFTASPGDKNTNSGFYNNNSSKKRRISKETRRYGKYDHVSSKVKEYRIAIRNQTTKRKNNSVYEDTEITSPEDLLKVIEKLKQEIEMKDAVIDRKDEEIAELIGKHIEEVALLKMSLDSFRYELMRLKGTIDISRPYSKQNNDTTPLKSIGNMLKTPIRSISNALLRTPLKTFSSTSIKATKDVQNKSITSDEVKVEEQSLYDESPFQISFLKSSVKKKSPNGFSEWAKFSNSNTASSVSKTSSDPTLIKTKEPRKMNILEQSISNVFSKVVYYSQKVFSKKIHTDFMDGKAPVDEDTNPQIATFKNSKMRNTRRRVSFSKTCTESPLPKIIIENTWDSPKPPPRKIKKFKIHKYISTKSTKENYIKSGVKSNADDCSNYKDHQSLITTHINEIIARSKEIKKTMQKL